MKLFRKLFWALTLFLGHEQQSKGQNLPAAWQHPSIQGKAGSGAGLTISRGPGAIFLNPANIIFTRFFESDADIGFSITNYSYQHALTTQYDLTTAQLTSFQTTLGATIRPILPLAISVGLVPSLTNKYQFENAPYHIGSGVYEISTVDVTQDSFRAGGAIAYKIIPILTLGAGVTLTNEKTAITATRPTENEPFLDMLYGGSFFQFLLGGRADLFAKKVSLGFSFKTASQKNFKGDYYLDTEENSGSDYSELKYQGYAPATIGVGGEFQLKNFGAFSDFRMNLWDGGIESRGIEAAPAQSDLQNNFEIIAGLKMWLMKDHMLMSGFGLFTPNKGDGTENDVDIAEGLEGMGLGDVEAIQRMVFSGGYRLRIKNKGYLMASGQYQMGTRSVPEGFSYEGDHTMSHLMGSIGGAYGF